MHGYLPYDGDRTSSNLPLPASHHLLRCPQYRQIQGALFLLGLSGSAGSDQVPGGQRKHSYLSLLSSHLKI